MIRRADYKTIRGLLAFLTQDCRQDAPYIGAPPFEIVKDINNIELDRS